MLLSTPFLPLTDFISRNAEWYPGKIAVICEGDRLTWRELNRRISRVSNYLHRVGICRGDRVAILSQNCLEYPEIMFGALKAGAVIVPLSAMLQREAVLLQLRDAEPKAIFACSTFVSRIEGHQPLINPVVLAGRAEGWTQYDDIQQTEAEADLAIKLAADDFYNIVYSSGTTGIPKGIIHTHQARVLFALTCGLEFRIHNDTIGLVSTPIYANGTQLVFLPTILAGGTIVLMRAFDPLGFLELVQREKCTHAFLVPTQFIRIMEHPHFYQYDTSSIEILLSAAAPLWKETRKEILEKFLKSRLSELYGVTEGISTVLRANEQSTKPGSVGKPRLGGDIKILDDKGQELSPGEIGEIAGTNFSMMAGYYRDPERTKEALWHDPKGNPYIKTGDIGWLDADGYLYIMDRKKDLIISGGINIFPSDLEEVLRAHPEVAEAAVIGIPHREWGESPLALIVKRNRDSSLSAADLRDWANNRLSGYQKLAAVEFRDFLPKNDLQKVLKNELRQPYWKDLTQ